MSLKSMLFGESNNGGNETNETSSAENIKAMIERQVPKILGVG